MSQQSKYTIKIEADSNNEPFFNIPEPLWKELEDIGWRHGDNLGFDAEPRRLKIKNLDREIRRK